MYVANMIGVRDQLSRPVDNSDVPEYEKTWFRPPGYTTYIPGLIDHYVIPYIFEEDNNKLI